MIFRIFIIFTTILFSLNATKANDGDLWKEANELYKNSKYDESIALYNEIIDNGGISSDLYYNLGNAYFKVDKIADAILFYERAKRLNPENEDIQFNLKIANLKIVDKIHAIPKLFLIEWYENIYSSLSSDSWSWLIIISSWLTFGFLLGYIIIFSTNTKKMFFFGALISFVALILFNIFAFEQNDNENRKDEAIVFAPSSYVKSSPSKTATDLFILHEGTKVNILDQDGDWKKIRIADGNVGWLLQKTIEVI